MDPLKQIDAEDSFTRRLRDNTLLTPEQKKRRLTYINNRASAHPGRAVIEQGQRFDRLEPPTDIPIAPAYGNTLPSKLQHADRHNKKVTPQ